LKWIKHINIRPETLKLPQDNIEKTCEDMDIGKDLLNRNPIDQEIRATVHKWN
jgi:hypothetical protein